jgi:hypothetical protein
MSSPARGLDREANIRFSLQSPSLGQTMLAQALSVNLTIYHYTSEMLMTRVMAWATLHSGESKNRERLPIWTYSASGCRNR